MAKVSTLGSKATGLGVLTAPSNVSYAMIMGILPSSVLNYLLIMYKHLTLPPQLLMLLGFLIQVQIIM
jgi:hypothetical protein